MFYSLSISAQGCKRCPSYLLSLVNLDTQKLVAVFCLIFACMYTAKRASLSAFRTVL